jgi:hypothetical protein
MARQPIIKRIRQVRGQAWLLVTLMVMFLAPLRAWAALPGDQNKFPEVCQGVVGAAYMANEILALTLPVPFDFPPTVGAYAANLDLTTCPPQIAAPPQVKRLPDAGQCYATFHQATTQAYYRNLLGAPFKWAGPWGDLGTPEVYHFNMQADVRVLRTDAQGGELDDAMLAGDIQLPVGKNVLRWRADTTVSPLDFVFLYLPHIPAGAEEKAVIKESKPLSQAALKLYNGIAKASHVIHNDVGDTYIDEFLITQNFRQSQIGVIADVSNEDTQSVWVYDTVPPTLSTNKDPSTFSDYLKPIVKYDAATDTYYMEAFQPGGVDNLQALNFARALLSYHDTCDRTVQLQLLNQPSAFWKVGTTTSLQWRAADPGPNEAGNPNYSPTVTQKFEVRDTNPPILVAPPSKVVEVSSNAPTTVPLGSPQVFDLADLAPQVSNNAPSAFGLGITTVDWTATDQSGNAVNKDQLINVKLAGTNHAPTAFDQSVDAISFKPVDIILKGRDPDFDPTSQRFDPLSFKIATRPQHGFFVAPLLPFFIDDYRLEAGSQRFKNEPNQVDPLQYCKDNPGASGWDMKYPYNAKWISVDDDGSTLVYDGGKMACNPSGDPSPEWRLVRFDPNGNMVYNSLENNTLSDVYIDQHSKQTYVTDITSQGQGELRFYDSQLNRLGAIDLNSGSNPAHNVIEPKFVAVDNQHFVYVGRGYGQVNAYSEPFAAYTGQRFSADTKYLGTLLTGGSDMRDIATDSKNNVYISVGALASTTSSDAFTHGNRIVKYTAATIDGQGHFTPGTLVGWMGRCNRNLTNTIACDTDNQRSIGFSCTDALCGVDNSGGGYGAGSDPGQFDNPNGIAIDPHDILYVADTDNDRVQRFTPDGFFAGQAKSTGQGYGFILGDFGNPVDITVNSDHFYILNDNLLHVFETTPVTPIDDTSAKVTYQSNNNFVGTDSFTFQASDGLASGTGTATVNVARNYRPPVIIVPPPPQTLNEDGSVTITLTGSDPDGALDVLSYVIVDPPKHGTLSGNGPAVVYTPDANYEGSDSFSYAVSDGTDTSTPASLAITVNPVPDPPTVDVPDALSVGLGFTFSLKVDVFDPDQGDTHKAQVDWGDGVVDDEGAITLDGQVKNDGALQADGTIPDNVEATGPILKLGSSGQGTVNFSHAYTKTGTYLVTTCVWDGVQILPDGTKQPTPSSHQVCKPTTVTVSLLAGLSMELSASPDKLDPGGNVHYIVTVTNRTFDVTVPNTPQGIAANNVSVTARAGRNLVLGTATPDQGNCTTNPASASCNLGALAYGTSTTIGIDAAADALAPGNRKLVLSVTAQADESGPDPVNAAGVATVNPSGKAPAATSIDPASGLQTGGYSVTIAGGNFDADAVVSFAGIPAVNVDVADANTLTAAVPAHAPGSVDVTISNSDGQAAALSGGFVYKAIPSSVTSGSTPGGGGGGGIVDPLTLLLAAFAAGLSRRRIRSA